MHTSSDRLSIAIIGAGLSGALIAYELTQSGYQCTVFDKARGCGGRLSNKRIESKQFEHGCFHLNLDKTAIEKHNLSFISKYSETVSFKTLNHKSGVQIETQFQIIKPTLNSVIKEMLADSNFSRNTLVDRIDYDDNQFHLSSQGHNLGSFSHLFVTPPPVQSAKLLYPIERELSRSCLKRKMHSQWVAMLETTDHPNSDLIVIKDDLIDKAIMLKHFSTENASKWVVHLNINWSEQNINLSPDRVTKILRERLNKLTLFSPQGITFIEMHRWRYSQSVEQEVMATVGSSKMPLYLAGDWSSDGGLQGAVKSAYRAIDQSKLLANQIKQS